MNPINDIETILILSSWSSGSTAITGFLEKNGGYVSEPRIFTNDPRTPNALEPKEYRDTLTECIDVLTFEYKKPREDFLNFFLSGILFKRRNVEMLAIRKLF